MSVQSIAFLVPFFFFFRGRLLFAVSMGIMEGGEEVTRGGHEECIFVSVRLRPLNEKEILKNDVSDWECINDTTIIYKNANLSASERSMYPTAYTFGKEMNVRLQFQSVILIVMVFYVSDNSLDFNFVAS